jgi:hypothetical protein
MTSDPKASGTFLGPNKGTRAAGHDPERLDMIIAAIGALHKAFENERAHQPFVSKAPCPYCGSGTVTYRYQAPLIGSMRCDTPDCLSYSL